MNFSALKWAAKQTGLATPRANLRTATRSFHSAQGIRNKKLIDDDLLDKADAATDDGSASSSSSSKKWKDTAKKSREESEESKKRRSWGLLFTGGLAAASVGFMSRPFDEAEAKQFPNVAANSWDPVSLWQRCRSRVVGTVDQFKEPVFDKLLPDAQSGPYGRPMTLVLGVDDLLVRHSWSREHGWRTAKRPGVDYFLNYLGQYYEIVLFSNKYMVYDQDVVQQLDPYHTAVSYALFREACRYDNGKVIKDLSHLNRDLTKVIAVDTDPEALCLQPENALVLPKWTGSKDDVDLIRLLNVLEYIATQNVKDVRPMIKTLEASGDPLDEFERRDRAYRAKNASRNSPKLGSLMGMSSGAPGQTQQDVIRQRAQRNYAKMQEYIEEHGKKLMEEEKKLMEEHSKTTLSKLVTQGGPSQQELEQAMLERMEENAKQGK